MKVGGRGVFFLPGASSRRTILDYLGLVSFLFLWSCGFLEAFCFSPLRDCSRWRKKKEL